MESRKIVSRLSKKNALGRVFWTLPKNLRDEIFKEDARIRKSSSKDCLRQYFFVNTKSNPEKLDSELKKFMIKISSKFEGCFVKNENNDAALEWLVESVFKKNSEIEQMAARRAHNPEVVGSSPALATAYFYNYKK